MLTVKVFTFNPVQENTYLLYNDAGDCCIVDPGCYFPEEEEVLADFVQKQGLRPSLLLNTHCHFDHVFGNRFVHKKWGVEPHIHPAEQPVLDRAAEAALRWQLPFENYQGPVHYLKEGEKLGWAGEEFEVLFTPGHSPGSISFYHAKQEFVLSGDVLFRGSIGRTDLPGGDYALLEQSIRQKMYVLPDACKVYPGHGLPTSIEVERKSNPFVKGEEFD